MLRQNMNIIRSYEQPPFSRFGPSKNIFFKFCRNQILCYLAISKLQEIKHKYFISEMHVSFKTLNPSWIVPLSATVDEIQPPKFTIFFHILRNYDKPTWYVCRLLTQKRQYVEESELQIWNQGSQILIFQNIKPIYLLIRKL